MTNEDFREQALILAGPLAEKNYLCCTVQMMKHRDGRFVADYGVYLSKVCNTQGTFCETPEEALRIFKQELEKAK